LEAAMTTVRFRKQAWTVGSRKRYNVRVTFNWGFQLL